MKLIATFYSHFGAIRFANQCKASNCVAKMMPVPRSLSSSCGTCVSYECDKLVPGDGRTNDKFGKSSDVLADMTKQISGAAQITETAQIPEEVEQIVEVTANGYVWLYRAKDS